MDQPARQLPRKFSMLCNFYMLPAPVMSKGEARRGTRGGETIASMTMPKHRLPFNEMSDTDFEQFMHSLD